MSLQLLRKRVNALGPPLGERGVTSVNEEARELRQCPHAALGDRLDRLRKSTDASIADLIVAKLEITELRQRPTGASLGQSRYASVANLVVGD